MSKPTILTPQAEKAPSEETLVYTIGENLYINLTDRCTLACEFCPKIQGSMDVHEYNLLLSHRHQVDEYIEKIGDPSQYEEIVFCGFGEPTLRLKALLEVATYCKQAGARVRVNTDGLGNLVNKRNILPDMAKCVDALSVSMNAQNEEVYDRHCVPALKGSFDSMLDFLRLAPDFIPDTTATAIDGLEGVDVEACEAKAHELGIKFRRRVLDIVG
ncbi:TatD family nuclease-associated radical SAM protein [sulfur-oxidizing endosymbiont of Gigantopelta aegis]|uniref:TatD family nuclease-associated radical SAM protein n=1 Tax=sulfur-oxidizing endosymbiont of Gigantopelta aegis TaxID=2794934 RepID=UPI001FEC6F38|nr:TatD family nuclease-associated radical SAM protein [sulfur-oxidizing endosymbiont of Gigantopelta aegis]